MPRDPGKPRSHTSASARRSTTPHLRATGPGRSSLGPSLNNLNLKSLSQQLTQESWYILSLPNLHSVLICIALKQSYSDSADSRSIEKTPVRGRNQSSIAITNSDKTHPEPLSAMQAIQPYYGPALATPSKPTPCHLGTSLQRQYAKIFHIDNGMFRLSNTFLI